MNWDKNMVERARTEGWRLVDTIDNGAAHVYALIARTQTSAFKTDQHATRYVIEQASNDSPLHRHALQLVMASKIKPKTKGKK